MWNTQWGFGIRLVIMICIILVMMAHKCVRGGNLTTIACSAQERLALLKFKHSIIDKNGMLTSWVGDDCCRWERVGCDYATGKVVGLHLGTKFRQEDYNMDSDNYLADSYYGAYEEYLVSDEVNSCLKELVNLRHLDMSGNRFQQSQIPEFIGSLKQLRYLNISNSGFSGNIPHQIGNLSNLKVLDLSSPSYGSQELVTHDMAWVSGLSKLEHLDLSGVNLSRTQNLDSLLYTIPSLLTLSLSRCDFSIAHLGFRHLNSSRKLSNIKHLDLSENYFRGQLPGLFLNMTSLTFLDLSNNYFSTAQIFENFLHMIPYVLDLRLANCELHTINLAPTNLNLSIHSNIQHLDLSDNGIEGRFPSVLTNMSSLLSLDLYDNILNSSIPVMPNLLKLDISGNNFRHIEDVGIWRQCHLKELIVSYNDLEGEMIGPSTNVSECSQYALEILYLNQNALTYSIPESLGKLVNLRGLDLSFNKVIGPIPESLGNLRSLQELHLSCNQLNGSIPESFGRLTALKRIFLSSNRFTGSSPASLGRFTSLRVLSMSSNLLNGTIPISVGQLTKLHYLDVSNNSLHGVVSEDNFANLSMLMYLDANFNNNLHFNISHEWIPPFQLRVIRLSSCKIEDEFPQWLRTQRKLKELVLSDTSISGPLPTWFRLMSVIRVLDLSYNKLTGSLENLPSIYEDRYETTKGKLILQNNLFRCMIPSLLCTWTTLDVLDLSRNRLTGKIRKCLWNLSMNVMLLSSNRLSGVIPSPLGCDKSLEWLQLNDNNFSGELPRDFGCFTNLKVLDLGENKISGNLPEWIGENITNLVDLRLHKNNFTGRIPLSFCKCSLLQILDLAHNYLTGSIPRCFGELENHGYMTTYRTRTLNSGNMMQVLKGVALEYTKTLDFVVNMDLSSNKLVGEIHEALTTLKALMGLNLSYNHFSGGIPQNIGNMKSLISLDLSANKLSGMIPHSMASLNFLSYLNLSHNNFSGQIPTGNQLQTLMDPSIYAGNTYLCGAPLPKECSPHENTTSKNRYDNGNEPKKVWFYLDIMSGFAAGFWGIVGVLFLKKQWRHKLFRFCEEIMDKIYIAVAIRVLKMKRGQGRETA